jgi:hypothetical protein
MVQQCVLSNTYSSELYWVKISGTIYFLFYFIYLKWLLGTKRKLESEWKTLFWVYWVLFHFYFCSMSTELLPWTAFFEKIEIQKTILMLIYWLSQKNNYWKPMLFINKSQKMTAESGSFLTKNRFWNESLYGEPSAEYLILFRYTKKSLFQPLTYMGFEVISAPVHQYTG